MKQCQINEMLRKICEGKTDPLSLEVSKLQYAKCLRAEEAKCHRDCMQRFTSGRAVKETRFNRRNFQEGKNTAFEKFCIWYESSSHESTALTLFDVQHWMKEFSSSSPTEGVYNIKQIDRKLKARFGDKLRFTSVDQQLCCYKRNQFILENSLKVPLTDLETEPDVDAGELNQITSVGSGIAACLNPDDEYKEFYSYANNLEKLTTEIPVRLSCLLDAMFAKSRTTKCHEKKDLCKIAAGHVIMQWCKKEGYQSPLLLAVGLFVHQITRSQVLVDVLCAMGFSLSYSAIMNFEKCAAISTIKFSDIQSNEESLERFLQFIANNFDHDEDTTTGASTTHVMGIISAEYPKSKFSRMQPNVKKHVSSKTMVETADLGNLVKAYEKPRISKFNKIVLKKPVIPEVDTSRFDKLDTFWLLSSLFIENKTSKYLCRISLMVLSWYTITICNKILPNNPTRSVFQRSHVQYTVIHKETNKGYEDLLHSSYI